MSDYIPHELLIDILTRLPVKSLLRFKSVCKSWYSLITNPSFIILHLNQITASNKKNTHTLLLRYYDKNDKKEHYSLRLDDETFGEQFSKLEFPFKSAIGYFRIVGSCNGLLCLSDDLFGDMETIIMWNPSIRKSVNIRMGSKPQWPHMFVLGFGICPVTHDPKVVKIVYLKDFSYNYKAPPEVEIYALSTGTWRSVGSIAPPYYMVEFTWSQAFVNGAVHWIAYDKCVQGGFRNLIVSFDMVDEVFREMMLPNTLAGELVTNLCINVLGESLAVLKYNKQIETASCCIWVMKEYGVAGSWTKLFTIDLPGMLKKTVAFRRNGEVILSMEDTKLVSYDPNTGQLKDLGILGTIRSFYVDNYMETLILLKEGLEISCDA